MRYVPLLAIALPAGFWFAADAQAPKPLTAPEPWTEVIAFEHHELPALGSAPASIRRVHPELERIAAWISAVGASVALLDHDGDGLNNDYCLVDPRFDSVTVGPVPTTGRRFTPFAVPWSEGGATPGSVAPMGCLPVDLDGNGRQDLVLYYWGRAPSLHFAVDGFVERPLLDTHEVWHTNAALVADVDGDGRLDLVFGNYFPDDVEVLGTAGSPRMQRSMSAARNAGRNRLFLADGEPGNFADHSHVLAAAEPIGWTLALGAADLDGDGLPELYVANDFGPDHLLHNRTRGGELAFARVTGRRGFTDPRSRVLGNDSFKGMSVEFADVDRDGQLDIYVSNIAEDYALMESHLLFRHTGDVAAFARGVAPFQEVSGRMGVARSAWGWDARFVDLTNDGWLELYQATGFLRGETNRWPELHEVAMGNDDLLPLPGVWPDFGPGADLSGNRRDALFVRGPAGRWREASAAVDLERATVSRGVAVGDVNGNGQMDIVVARQWQPSVVLINRSETAAAGLVVVPRIPLGAGLTRPAHGARVTLRAMSGEGPELVRVVPGGEGHSGKSAPEVHFGLGPFVPGEALELEVVWRDAAGLHRRTEPAPWGGRKRMVLHQPTTVAFGDAAGNAR